MKNREAVQGDRISFRTTNPLNGNTKERTDIVTSVGLGGVFVKEIFLKHGEYTITNDLIENIKEEIEQVRSDMNGLANAFGLMNEAVLKVSQHLDDLMNRLDRLKREEDE